jgi:N,N'-diacetyllegionaminate synthase
MIHHTTIIAEAGVNHNGNLDLAKQLVDIAADAGADFVKFQTFKASRLVTQNALKAEYQLSTTSKNQSQFEMLNQLELTEEMHESLIAYCKKKKIGFFATAFDIQSLDYLNKLGLDRFKIPSGEITNLPYLRHISSFGKPLILSTGMSTLHEIENALKVLEENSVSRKNITVLHCNTEYPTPMEDVNLKAMCTIRDTLGVEVGYSDHTLGTEVAIAAVTLGATVIEKHFTTDRNLQGPDHKVSLEPTELKNMVSSIRNIEKALGSNIKQPSQSELKNKYIVRKSLVAIQPIQTGEFFTKENIAPKRPGTGVSPMHWDRVIGQVANRSYVIDELIEI